jgi:hypothetical protein
LYRGNYNAAEKVLEETLVLFRDLGNPMGIAHVYHCQADLALHQGNYNRAAKLVSDSLSMARSLLTNISNREFSIMRLLIVGKLAYIHQDFEKAAQLLGSAESLREQNNYLFEPAIRAEYVEAVAQVRAQLYPAVFEVAWAEGQVMIEAEAITSALVYLQAEFDVLG